MKYLIETKPERTGLKVPPPPPPKRPRTTHVYLKYSHALGLWDVRRDSDQAILKSFPQKSLAATWAKKQAYTIVPE